MFLHLNMIFINMFVGRVLNKTQSNTSKMNQIKVYLHEVNLNNWPSLLQVPILF
jgi:hypothetical protein